MIDADVTEVLTQRPATGLSRHGDLMRKANGGKTIISNGPWAPAPADPVLATMAHGTQVNRTCLGGDGR